MINNYTNLSEAILKWCNKKETDSGFVSQIPLFISLAEQQMFIDCPTVFTQNYLVNSFTKNIPYINKPEDWGRTLSLYIFDDTSIPSSLAPDKLNPDSFAVERVTFERGLLFSKKQNKLGKPNYYTDCAEGTIQLFPTPDADYPFLISYYSKPSPLSVENQQNVNSLNNFDTLFYACLSKAYIYLNDKENSTFCDSLYKERMNVFVTYDKNRLVDRDTTSKTTNDFF